MQNSIEKLSSDVATLQKDTAIIEKLVGRLDVTIEKLTEVSTTVSQLLAVQANRLESQQRVADKLEDLVEKRKIESESAMKDVHARIDYVEQELETTIEKSNHKILDEIKSHRTDSAKQHEQMSDRMSKLEKWTWLVIGGATALSALLSNIDFSNLF